MSIDLENIYKILPNMLFFCYLLFLFKSSDQKCIYNALGYMFTMCEITFNEYKKNLKFKMLF